MSKANQDLVLRYYSLNAEETGIVFFTLEGRKVTRISDFWPEPYEPPERKSRFVEQY